MCGQPPVCSCCWRSCSAGGTALAVVELAEQRLADDLDEMQARNMQTTMSTVAASIAKAVQQRAEEAGIPCTVNVEMANDADGLLQVDKVTVYYDSTAANRLSELQSLLTKECGVPAERQELIAR